MVKLSKPCVLGNSVVICACSRVWGRAGPIWAIRGVGGVGGRIGAFLVLPPVKLYFWNGIG